MWAPVCTLVTVEPSSPRMVGACLLHVRRNLCVHCPRGTRWPSTESQLSCSLLRAGVLLPRPALMENSLLLERIEWTRPICPLFLPELWEEHSVPPAPVDRVSATVLMSPYEDEVSLKPGVPPPRSSLVAGGAWGLLLILSLGLRGRNGACRLPSWKWWWAGSRRRGPGTGHLRKQDRIK